jgi:hypothetical protein
MAVDTSIYQNAGGGLAEGIQQGMTLGQMYKQKKRDDKIQKEEDEVKSAFSRNVTQNPDGTLGLNRKALLSDLYKTSPVKAIETENTFRAQDAAAEKQKYETQQRNIQMTAQLLSGVKDQVTYEAAIAEGTRLGIPGVDRMPTTYSKDLTDRALAQVLTAKEQFDLRFKERELEQKDRELRMKEREASVGPGGLTEGEKAVDRDYAKDYNDFTGGGRAKALDSIKKLKDFRAQMAADINDGGLEAGGGPVAGSLPDFLRTQKSISQRDNIVSVANSALKATFGGQLSDGERKALANEFYNDKLSNSENIKVIDRKIQELENALQSQTAKTKHYEKNRSLKGFKIGDSPSTETKTVGGVTYKKVEGGWEEVE